MSRFRCHSVTDPKFDTAFFATSLAESCSDYTSYRDSFLHIVYSGSTKFSVSLQQHNKWCDDTRSPFPETVDSVQAARYARNDTDIYIPMSHFNIDMVRTSGIALEGFWSTRPTYFYRIEIVNNLPPGVVEPPKLPSGNLHVSCKDDNMIAFGIDDGSPSLAQRTITILYEENIPATFFVQGTALLDHDSNFTAAYREAYDRGYQIGLHTFDHPHMEGLQTDQEIDLEISKNIEIVAQQLGMYTSYFRPPYGTVAARTRDSLAKQITNPQIMMWSIDVEDWIYGPTDKDNMQYKAFERSLKKGGDMVVMHYLYESTVDQFRDMIKLARAQGRQFVRMDQCIGDPNAPEIWGWKRPSSQQGGQ